MTDTNDAAMPGPDQDPAAAEAEQLVTDIDTLQRERDDLLDTTRRLQADFENYRKRVLRRHCVTSSSP
jgi:molecular chaperone GrpE (heat shock protein)